MRIVPNFKGIDFFPHGTMLPFMKFKTPCFVASIVTMALALLIIGVKGFNYGVDFKGGTLLEVQSKAGPADVTALRSKLNGLGLGDVQIQSFGSATDVLIRVGLQAGKDEKDSEVKQQEAAKTVLASLGSGFELRRQEIVGPAVSSELRTTGVIAVLSSILAIIAYVWFRFEWQFSVGTVVALAHDVLITAGLFSLFQFEFDLQIVAALLTILGYSVNDTVVVADRIRENLRRYKRMPLNELLNLSINETLSRTILTGMTTIVVLVVLYIWGGEVIRNFNLAMLFGVLIGTYSSIFISAPILDYLGVKRDWSEAAASGGQKPRV